MDDLPTPYRLKHFVSRFKVVNEHADLGIVCRAGQESSNLPLHALHFGRISGVACGQIVD